MNVFEIACTSKQLPQGIDKLVPLSFIGSSAVKFYKQKLKLFDDLKMTDTQKKKTLADGQDAGVMLLEIERRIGEISETIPIAKPGEIGSKSNQSHLTEKSREVKAIKMGLKTGHQLHTAQTIKNHPKEVAEVIKEAKANDDIPTKTAVINKVRFQKEQERRKKAESKKTENKLILKLDEQRYIMALEGIIRDLPDKPPTKWSEQGFSMAQGLADIITKRLSVFNISKTKGVK